MQKPSVTWSIKFDVLLAVLIGGSAVRRRTRNRKVAGSGSTPGVTGRSAIKSTRSIQPSIPPGYVNRVPACMARVRRGAFTCDGWQVILCDPIWQVTSRSSEMGIPMKSYIGLYLFPAFYYTHYTLHRL